MYNAVHEIIHLAPPEKAVGITYFRRRRIGPELAIENAVASQIPRLVGGPSFKIWAGASPALGAGRPDLVIVRCEPQVLSLAHVNITHAEILAYLRAVGRARVDTIGDRLGRPRSLVVTCLAGLVEIEAVHGGAGVYELTQEWREILPEILTVEAKVADWRKAAAQAARNQIFAHRSFVALPSPVAQRVKREDLFRRSGVGVLAVHEDGNVVQARGARRRQPRVWAYYYRLAFLVANYSNGGDHGLQAALAGS